MNYYNENDKRIAKWLQWLINNGRVPEGKVDTRSICEVSAGDVAGFRQCHFFAGIGGWSRALQLSEWGDKGGVWTGSCPCQPFSNAGKGEGKGDKRHLWPEFWRLIRECRPDVVFGEQVESAIRHGWFDDIRTDLEGEGYTVGGAVLGAHSAGAWHIRQRLYWVADSKERDGYMCEDNGSGIREAVFEQPEFRDCCGEGMRGGIDWANCESIPCMLADGFPAELAHGYGNAIVPQVGAMFIDAFLYCVG